MPFDRAILPAQPNYAAPDGSEIRLLSQGRMGGLCHCSLPAGATSLAVAHKTVEEIWYFIEGQGQVWRKAQHEESIAEVSAGISVTIPVRTEFQFRNTGNVPLRFIIATMPPWPGAQEAERVPDHWPAS